MKAPGRQRPEMALQRQCVDLLRKFVPGPPDGPYYCAINPVPAKSKAVAGMSKAMGMRAGIPDLILVVQDQPPVFVEFKAGKKGRMSPAQVETSVDLRALGATVHECRNLEEFVGILEHHGIPHRIDLRFYKVTLPTTA